MHMGKFDIHHSKIFIALKLDDVYAESYLSAAFNKLNEIEGEVEFLIALRNIVEARGGISCIAEKAGVSRENLYKALSKKGNPTLKTVRLVINALGLRFPNDIISE